MLTHRVLSILSTIEHPMHYNGKSMKKRDKIQQCKQFKIQYAKWY